mmetsp:Transcript_45/g.64  ORF Transcript_45/g.64 Transcript_45/m.64 type:complete len:305 (+) Transcript_45:180-1094(+)|eukprot:CAMPEP_0194210432 /NCGR_PEP_ID=MMETSP0156-20130528/8476_1 /TAXON_ID=33649 /ORGANISM="Thalassionema nitzschioides, Strain L26-B" /LENGTH=304 /DNA_ID=CAMNT_0038937777 /DNA_START=85 /DNA_END=999 /DNA_ORIENTATION=-
MSSFAVLILLVSLLLVNEISAFVAPQTFASNKSLLPIFMADEEKVAAKTRSDAECQPADGEYCMVDDKTGKLIKLTIAEKERIFLDALQAYYASGRQLLPDEEFDLLKEDLQWNGSELIEMNRKEAQYLAAMEAYLKGTPTLSDEEFDSLKRELKESNSKFAVSRQPKCLIDTGICTVTLQEDQFRSNLLYLPALTILVSVWLGPVFEIVANFVIRLNPLFFLLVAAYPIYIACIAITDQFIFTNKKIAFGPCPSCEFENRVYFGNVLGVEGFDQQADVKCRNCKTQFSVQRDSLRASTLPKDE